MKIEGWVAIRLNSHDNKEWIDLDTFSISSPEVCRQRVMKDELLLPHWQESNKVVRIVKVEIKELPEASHE